MVCVYECLLWFVSMNVAIDWLMCHVCKALVLMVFCSQDNTILLYRVAFFISERAVALYVGLPNTAPPTNT